jgi:peroxiredoxin Q/BCP
MTANKQGEVIADFEGAATGAKTWRLTDFRGRFVIVYFYPKDHTPGCTQQGQDFRDRIDQFSALNAVVIGVSRDTLRSHEGFKAKQQFPFDLITDEDEKLCDHFDVIKMKTMYGKQVRGIERSTFLLGPDGVLIREWRKVKVKNHVDEVLQALRDAAYGA